jgi:hypothetical protein
MASFNELQEILARQQLTATADPNYPLNKLQGKRENFNGVMMTKAEYAELQHDLAEYSANPEKFERNIADSSATDSAKQATIDRQRRLVAEIKRNEGARPNNGARDPKKPVQNKEEMAILSLAQRAGFKVPETDSKYSSTLANQPDELMDIKEIGKRNENPFGSKSLISDLQTPPDDEEIVSEII